MDLLTRTEEIILLSVHELRDSAYGVTIRDLAADLTGRRWSIGAIYVPLDRLMRKGFLKSHSGDPTHQRGGRRKRLYRLTAKGVTALKETKELQDKLWAAIPGVSALRPRPA